MVITIIVLLILAGVTIASLTGDNGLLTKARQAQEDTKIQQRLFVPMEKLKNNISS